MKNLFEKSLCKESLACIWHPTISRLDESTFTSLSPIANHGRHHLRHQLSLSSRSSLGSLHIIFFNNYFCPNYLMSEDDTSIFSYASYSLTTNLYFHIFTFLHPQSCPHFIKFTLSHTSPQL